MEYDSDTKDGASIQLSAFLIWYIVVHMEEVPLTILKVWEGGGSIPPVPSLEYGDVAQLVECRTGTPLTQVRFPGAAMDFSPRVNFQCRLSYGVRTTPCTIACTSICAHVKDSVVHVRVRWIIETLKHPACTPGWGAHLYRSWLSPGKATRISHGRNPIGTIQL